MRCRHVCNDCFTCAQVGLWTFCGHPAFRRRGAVRGRVEHHWQHGRTLGHHSHVSGARFVFSTSRTHFRRYLDGRAWRACTENGRSPHAEGQAALETLAQPPQGAAPAVPLHELARGRQRHVSTRGEGDRDAECDGYLQLVPVSHESISFGYMSVHAHVMLTLRRCHEHLRVSLSAATSCMKSRPAGACEKNTCMNLASCVIP